MRLNFENTIEPYVYYLHTPLLILSAVVSLVLAAAAWRRRPTPGAGSLATMMVAGAFWGLAYALELGSSELAVRSLWGEIKYIGIALIPYTWLIFALRYTGRDGWLMTHGKRKFALLAAIPLATVVIALTNGTHHLLRSYEKRTVPGTPPEIIHGPWFWVNTSYSYLLLLIGTFLLLSTLFGRPRPYHGQWVAVAVGSLAPWAANIIYVLDMGVLGGLDPTPIGFTLTGGILLWGCLHSSLLDMAPVAREAVVEEMADGLIVADGHGRILDTNRAAQVILGLSGAVTPGRELADLLPSLSTLPILATLHQTPHRGIREHPSQERQPRDFSHKEHPTITREIRLGERQDQRYYELEISPLRSGNGVPVEGIIIILRDTTERKQAEEALAENQERLSHQAFHDPLTGLPNRYLFERRLGEAPRRSRTGERAGQRTGGHRSGSQDGSYLAILFMDLDGFKAVNDSLGHSAGDSLLRTVAERLEAGVRAQDTAARFGGDEFCVLLAGVSGAAEAVWIARRLGEALRVPFTIDTSAVRISASIGVAIGLVDSEDRSLDELVREADAAMYRAKKKGGALHEVVELD